MLKDRIIFRRSSSTFYFSSLIFPRSVRKDVFALYSFLRTADDWVDEMPASPELLGEMIKAWDASKKGRNFSCKNIQNTRTIENILRLSKKYNFDPAWVDKFLDSMESDIHFQSKKTLMQSLKYCTGSAESVGLMMSRILDLPEELDTQAKLLGRAFQWANFIRDIDEDNRLKRMYFPRRDLVKFGLNDLEKSTAQTRPIQFAGFINYQIERYEKWCDEALAVFEKIPLRKRLPLLVSVRLFDWAIQRIKHDPQVIFNKKLKPSKARASYFVFAELARCVR